MATNAPTPIARCAACSPPRHRAARRGDGVVPGLDRAPPSATLGELARCSPCISALLLVCERIPRTWIRFGPIGVVTPLWLFAYALMLLGSPSAGVGVALLGAAMNSMARDDDGVGRGASGRRHGALAVDRRVDPAGDGRARLDHAGRDGALGLGPGDRAGGHVDRRCSTPPSPRSRSRCGAGSRSSRCCVAGSGCGSRPKGR